MRLRRARYYARLAESFYDASDKTALPASATLTYYGMLNLVKSLLSLRGTELETRQEHHGATLPRDDQFTVAVLSSGGNDINVFHSFVEELGGERPVKRTHKISEVASHLPSLHEIVFSVGEMPHGKRKFLPVEISLKVTPSHDYLFSEVSYSKKHERLVNASKFFKGARRDYFQKLEGVSPITFRSKKRKRLRPKGANMVRLYRNVQKEYAQLGFASVLTRRGYRYYCDLAPGRYPQLAHALLLAFYYGSAARYRPIEFENLLLSDQRPIVSEFMSLCPSQFLYQLTGLITGRECVVPLAKI